jgi:RNA polymerase sigma-70 factor (ECF subfamily)
MSLRARDKNLLCEASSDEELVAEAQGGNEQAVRLLIQRYNQRLFRTARGLVRDDAEAEDIVQEAYVRAFSHLRSFHGDAQFATWLTRILLNVAYGRLRQRRPTIELSELETHAGADGRGCIIMFPGVPASTNPESEAGREQVRQVLEQAIDRIPQAFRLVFILRDIQGLSIEETATLLSIRPETVKTRLFRARQMMRTEVAKVLSPHFSELFPFAGERCARLTEQALEKLRDMNPPGSS